MIDYSPSGSTTSGDYHNNVVTSSSSSKPADSSTTEPVKPISPYASFFRDTVSSIQEQNPDISFQEISKIVNTMWEALPAVNKNIYKRQYEDEKREYVKAMNDFQNSQSQIDSKDNDEDDDEEEEENNVVTISPQVYNSDIPVEKVAPIHVSSSTPVTKTNLVTTNGDSTEDILSILSANICIRDGCGMTATVNPDWDGEYCSYDCVVLHTKTVFSKWVQGNQLTNACN